MNARSRAAETMKERDCVLGMSVCTPTTTCIHIAVHCRKWGGFVCWAEVVSQCLVRHCSEGINHGVSVSAYLGDGLRHFNVDGREEGFEEVGVVELWDVGESGDLGGRTTLRGLDIGERQYIFYWRRHSGK